MRGKLYRAYFLTFANFGFFRRFFRDFMPDRADGNRNKDSKDVELTHVQQFDKLFSDPVTPHSGAKKQRSSSQHGQNNRRTIKQGEFVCFMD